MTTRRTITSGLVLAIAASLSASAASVTITDSIPHTSTAATYNLTADYGELDWAIWYYNTAADGVSGAPTIQKNDATLIGDVTPVGGTILNGRPDNDVKAVYSFTDGTGGSSPVGPGVAGVTIGNSQHAVGKGVQVTVELPGDGMYKIHVWAACYRAKGKLTVSVPGASASDTNLYEVTDGTRRYGHYYGVLVDPDSPGQDATIDLVVDVNEGQYTHVLLSAVAVEEVAFTHLPVGTLFKVDLNDAIAAPAGWTTVDAPATYVPLSDANGTVYDDVTVSTTDLNTSTTTGQEGAYDGGFWDEASSDYVYTASSGTLTIKGLDAADTYTLKLISSFVNSSVSDFQVNGSFGDGSSPYNGDDFNCDTDGYDNAREMTFSGVSPNSSGKITIGVQQVSISARLSAFTIGVEPPLGTMISIY